MEQQQESLAGRRFVARYEQRAHVHRLHPGRVARLLLAFASFTFGLLNVFIPGPGGSVFILGAAFLVSGESRTFARLLDWGELRFQRQVRWVLEHPVVAVATITTLVFALTAWAGWALSA